MYSGPLIRVGAAAELTGLSRTTLRELAKNGVLTARRIGGQRWFYRDEVEQWLRNPERVEFRRAQARAERRRESVELGRELRRVNCEG